MSISLRPQYGTRGAIPPSAEQISTKSDSSLNKREEADIQKRITGLINNFTKPRQFFNFVDNPRLPKSEQQEVLNGQHWTCLFQGLSKVSKLTKEDDRLKINTMYEKFLLQLKGTSEKKITLERIQNAVLVKSISELPVTNLQLTNYLYDATVEKIELYTPKEITMLLNGGRSIFSKEQMIRLLKNVQKFFLENPEGQKLLLALTPHTIATILRTSCWTEMTYSVIPLLDDVLLKKADSEFAKFSNKELIDLIRGIGHYRHLAKGGEMLKRIENQLQAMKVDQPDFLVPMLINFSKITFLPMTFLPKIRDLLQDLSVNLSDKISLFYSLACLGYQEIAPIFSVFLEQLTIVSNSGIPVWQTISIKDLFYLLYPAASLHNEFQKHPVIYEIALHVDSNFKNLSSNQQSALGEVLCCLGMKKKGLSYMQTHSKQLPTPVLSSSQIEVMQKIQQWLKESKIHNVTLEENYQVHGRYIDFAVKIQTDKEDLILVEVDSLFHRCCNDYKRSLGKNRIRNRMLVQLDYKICILKPAKDDKKHISIKNLIELLSYKVNNQL